MGLDAVSTKLDQTNYRGDGDLAKSWQHLYFLLLTNIHMLSQRIIAVARGRGVLRPKHFQDASKILCDFFPILQQLDRIF